MTDAINLALQAFANGKPIVIIDDNTRENEGDLVLPAECATEENLAFLIREARGLMCIPAAPEILESLELPMMVESSNDKNGTPFTVSVDAADESITTGMPVAERLLTISKFLADELDPKSLARPGHLFPLRAKPGLLHERRGHTEASVALMKILGYKPVAIIAEIINDDGTMARDETLDNFVDKHNLTVLTVEEIAQAYDEQTQGI